MSKAKRKFYD